MSCTHPVTMRLAILLWVSLQPCAHINSCKHKHSCKNGFSLQFASSSFHLQTNCWDLKRCLKYTSIKATITSGLSLLSTALSKDLNAEINKCLVHLRNSDHRDSTRAKGKLPDFKSEDLGSRHNLVYCWNLGKSKFFLGLTVFWSAKVDNNFKHPRMDAMNVNVKQHVVET